MTQLPRRPHLSDDALRKIQDLEKLTGYIFTDKHNAWKAIQVVHKVRKRSNRGNRGIALLGDSLFYTILCQGWLPIHDPDELHGTEWHRIRNQYATNRHFANSVRGRLEDCLMYDDVGGKNSLDDEKLGTAVEAIIAAVYLDSGTSVRQAERVAVVFGILPGTHVTTDRIRFWTEDEAGQVEYEGGETGHGQVEKLIEGLDEGDDDHEADTENYIKEKRNEDLLGDLNDTSTIVAGPHGTVANSPAAPFGLLSNVELLALLSTELACTPPANPNLRLSDNVTNVQALATLSFGGTGTVSDQKGSSDGDRQGQERMQDEEDLLGEVDDTFSIMGGPVWNAVDTPGDLLGLISDTGQLPAVYPVLPFSGSNSLMRFSKG